MDAEKQIKEFLSRPNNLLDFWQALELYSAHERSKKNVILSLNQRPKARVSAEKIIYELESLVNAKQSNRFAVFVPDNVLNNISSAKRKLAENISPEVLESYEYAVDYKQLPAEMQKLVQEKAELYKKLDKSKKELAQLGTSNENTVILKRQKLMKSMQELVARIKSIHATLRAYEDSQTKPVAPIVDEFEEEKIPLLFDKELNDKFNYLKMDYFARKDLLSRLLARRLKYIKRFDEVTGTELENLQKVMDLNNRMIEMLQDFFKKNPRKNVV
jgi:hypothetical protein